MINRTAQEQYQLTWKVRRLFKLLAATADIYLTDMGIRAHERAVMEHLHNWGDSSVPQIARLFYVSRQNIQVRVNSLIKKGLLEKKQNPAHQRSVLLGLTDKGKQLFADIQETEAKLMADIFHNIPQNDINRASITLSKLADNLTDKLSEEPENGREPLITQKE